MDIREGGRERERVRNMTASTTANLPRAVSFTAAAPYRVKGRRRRSHKRALRLPSRSLSSGVDRIMVISSATISLPWIHISCLGKRASEQV